MKNKKNELKILYSIILAILCGFSSVYFNKIISFSGIVNVSSNEGVNSMVVYLISIFMVVFIGFIIIKYFKKRIKQDEYL